MVVSRSCAPRSPGCHPTPPRFDRRPSGQDGHERGAHDPLRRRRRIDGRGVDPCAAADGMTAGTPTAACRERHAWLCAGRRRDAQRTLPRAFDRDITRSRHDPVLFPSENTSTYWTPGGSAKRSPCRRPLLHQNRPGSSLSPQAASASRRVVPLGGGGRCRLARTIGLTRPVQPQAFLVRRPPRRG